MSMLMSEEPPGMEKGRRRVFISYSHADEPQASRIEQVIQAAGFEVWRDRNDIRPGEIIADRIKQGITGSDYYLLLLTADSSRSEWVRSEIAFAFQLALAKKTTVVPALAADVDLPFEFSGYLYIDFRKSFERGLLELSNFFKSQSETAGAVSAKLGRNVPRHHPGDSASCEAILRGAKLGSLRYAMSDRLTIDQVAVIWFDVFERRMDEEVNRPNISLACVELIDRARREDAVPTLLKIVCRNTPKIASHPALFD